MRVDVSGSKFNFPQQCACCGNSAQTMMEVEASRSTGKKVVHTTTKAWEFPYCSDCTNHVQTVRLATSAAIVIIIASLLLAGYFYFIATASRLAILVSIGGIVGGIVTYGSLMAMAKASCNSNCVSARLAVRYLGWRTTCHMFEIMSDSYAFAFMMENRNKLVNVKPEVWEWLRAGVYITQPKQAQSARRSIS